MRTEIATLMFIAAGLTVSCRREHHDQQASAAAPTRADQVKRGAYLVVVAGCDDCHTPGGFYGAQDHTRRLSGSELGWNGPWGTSYPRNLTPDVATGLGSWSEHDIVKALRTGVRPDGSVLLPPMPWPNYAQLSDEDAFAIAAYLKSLPPIAHRAPPVLPPDRKPDGGSLILPTAPSWDAPRPPGIGGGPTPN